MLTQMFSQLQAVVPGLDAKLENDELTIKTPNGMLICSTPGEIRGALSAAILVGHFVKQQAALQAEYEEMMDDEDRYYGRNQGQWDDDQVYDGFQDDNPTDDEEDEIQIGDIEAWQHPTLPNLVLLRAVTTEGSSVLQALSATAWLDRSEMYCDSYVMARGSFDTPAMQQALNYEWSHMPLPLRK